MNGQAADTARDATKGVREDHLVGYAPMDATHEEFAGLLSALLRAEDDGLCDALEAVLVHTRAHFEAEERWMLDSDFPPRDCHIDEHAAVLKSMEEVLALARGGDCSHVRRLADAVADWFPGHVDYLDSALAHWLCARQLGGKPVVLHRAPARGVAA